MTSLFCSSNVYTVFNSIYWTFPHSSNKNGYFIEIDGFFPFFFLTFTSNTEYPGYCFCRTEIVIIIMLL